MKKLLIILTVLLSTLSFGCKKNQTENTSTSNQPQFVMGLDDSFPPMGFRNESNEIVGFDVDLAKEVTKKLNMELILQPIDWGTKELELNSGKITCIWNGLSVSPARQESMTLSKPYLANRMVIITKANSPINTKADLVSKHVGLQTGSTAVQALEKDPISQKVIKSTYDNNVLALQDLDIGRIDAVVMDEVVARYMLNKKAGEYKVAKEYFNEEYYAIAFKKGNTELKDKVEKALDELIADGTASQISIKWFGEDIIKK